MRFVKEGSSLIGQQWQSLIAVTQVNRMDTEAETYTSCVWDCVMWCVLPLEIQSHQSDVSNKTNLHVNQWLLNVRAHHSTFKLLIANQWGC